MKVAVIGCGSIGARHARNLKMLGHEPELADLDGQRTRELAVDLCREFSHTVWDSERQDVWRIPTIRMCNEQTVGGPDAVMICTPAHTHTSILLQLRVLGYSGPLFVEKPICDLFDTRTWNDWPHPTTMVGYQLRYHPVIEAMRALPRIDAGTFRLECDMRTWPGQAYGDFLSECSHEVDVALYLGANRLTAARVTDQSAWLEFDEDRWNISIESRVAQYRREWSAETFGPGTTRAAITAKYYDPEALGNVAYLRELEHFLDCAHRGVPTRTPFGEGLRVLEVIEQAKALAHV